VTPAGADFIELFRKLLGQCFGGREPAFKDPVGRPTYGCYASTNRRSRQAAYRVVCSKLATLSDNVDRPKRKAEVRAELIKRLDVKCADSGPGGT